MKIKKIISAPLAAIVAATLCLAAPRRVLAHGGQIETGGGGGGGGGPVFLTKVQEEFIGLKTVKADFRSVDTVLLLNGRVLIDPDRHAHVTTRISGRIDQLFARIGDSVEKGQKLAVIQSRQLGDPPPTVDVTAPVGGIISERSVSLGDSVEPNTELFHIVDLSTVIVVAQVYEEDVDKVKLQQPGRIAALSYPTAQFSGKVTSMSPELDPNTRTLPVWLTVDNPGGKLRANMFVRVALRLARNPEVLTVPRAAVLTEAGEKFVFVRTGDMFERADIQTGAEDDRYMEVKNGLVPDDEVVTDGQRELYTSWLTGSNKKPASGKD